MKRYVRLDFKEINRSLLGNAQALLLEWLPSGKVKGNEFVCGNLQGDHGASLKINLKTGVWMDFASGEKGGDLISLFAAIKSLRQIESARLLHIRALKIGSSNDTL